MDCDQEIHGSKSITHDLLPLVVHHLVLESRGIDIPQEGLAHYQFLCRKRVTKEGQKKRKKKKTGLVHGAR